jgi:hypothetical protein
VAAGKNQARLWSWQTMVAHARHYLVEGIVATTYISPSGLLRGNPRSKSLRSNNDDACRHSPHWGHHFFWSTHLLEVALRWSIMSLPSSTMGLDDVDPWSLNGGPGLRA